MLRHLSCAVLVASHLTFVSGHDQHAQRVLEQSSGISSVPRIAIIGAGIAGAASAFTFYEEAYPKQNLDITVFEQASHIGGRLRSIFVPDARIDALELGAGSFSSSMDWCLAELTRNTGLRTHEAYFSIHAPSLLWDGRNVSDFFGCDLASKTWKDTMKEFWRYKLAPWSASRKFRRLSNLWRAFAHWAIFFDPIETFIDSKNFDPEVMQAASDYVRNAGTNKAFQREVLQPCMRANMLGDLDEMRGLQLAKACGPNDQVSIEGGNVRLIDRLIKLSGAHLMLNTRVVDISKGSSKRYRIIYEAEESQEGPHESEFDVVIVAASIPEPKTSPLNFGGLAANLRSFSDQESLQKQGTDLSIHVTYFTSPASFNSSYFTRGTDVEVPRFVNVFTTSTSLDILSLRSDEICFLRGCFPGDECDQCEDEVLYQVMSRNELTNEDLIRMLQQSGADSPEITWISRATWQHAYPNLSQKGKVLFPNSMTLAPGLYHLGMAEQIMPGWETSCRIGMHTAQRSWRMDIKGEKYTDWL